MKLPMTIALALAASLLAGAAATPRPPVAMSAMTGGGGIEKKIQFPRLTRLLDAKVMARVNAALVKKEADERHGAADCVAMVKDATAGPKHPEWG